MPGLEPKADHVVRAAVDAYLEGRFTPRCEGETVFETKNSRYRLMDGTLTFGPDASMIGAELVGWLVTAPRERVVESWQPRARAVLVDRKRDNHIIVTSATRMMRHDDAEIAATAEVDEGHAGGSAAATVHPPTMPPQIALPVIPPPPPVPSHVAPPGFAHATHAAHATRTPQPPATRDVAAFSAQPASSPPPVNTPPPAPIAHTSQPPAARTPLPPAAQTASRSAPPTAHAPFADARAPVTSAPAFNLKRTMLAVPRTAPPPAPTHGSAPPPAQPAQPTSNEMPSEPAQPRAARPIFLGAAADLATTPIPDVLLPEAPAAPLLPIAQNPFLTPAEPSGPESAPFSSIGRHAHLPPPPPATNPPPPMPAPLRASQLPPPMPPMRASQLPPPMPQAHTSQRPPPVVPHATPLPVPASPTSRPMRTQPPHAPPRPLPSTPPPQLSPPPASPPRGAASDQRLAFEDDDDGEMTHPQLPPIPLTRPLYAPDPAARSPLSDPISTAEAQPPSEAPFLLARSAPVVIDDIDDTEETQDAAPTVKPLAFPIPPAPPSAEPIPLARPVRRGPT